MPNAPSTQTAAPTDRFKLGLIANRVPATNTSAPATINSTAPVDLLTVSIIRENEKITTPSPTAASTGNSIGLSSRLRAAVLCDKSVDARSLHACTIHSLSAANNTTMPPKKTIDDVTKPRARKTTPTADISGHMLCVTNSEVEVFASRVVPSDVNAAKPASNAPTAIKKLIATPTRASFSNNATDIINATTDRTVTPKKYLKPVENIIPTFERKPRTKVRQKSPTPHSNKVRAPRPDRDRQRDRRST